LAFIYFFYVIVHQEISSRPYEKKNSERKKGRLDKQDSN